MFKWHVDKIMIIWEILKPVSENINILIMEAYERGEGTRRILPRQILPALSINRARLTFVLRSEESFYRET